MSHYLIVAYQTAGGRPLRNKIEEIARDDPDAGFALLVPATHVDDLFAWTEGEARAVAEERAKQAAGQLREAGVDLKEVIVGAADPFVAVSEELARNPDYGTIIVSTFPAGISRWLRLDLPTRLEKRFDLPVVHVVVSPEETAAE